ncbi:MAG: ABC transporter ATP-binding protein [Elusimicrobiota bacterium]
MNIKNNNNAGIILKINELRKTYVQKHFFKKKTTLALRGLNLEIHRNEIFSIMGLNGSGKTTTIKILLGLIRNDSGYFNILGRRGLSNDVKSKIGYMPEIPAFNTDFTPREMLSIWGSLSGIKKNKIKKRTDEVLEYTSLSHASEKKIKGFSKGMQQRLGLAQALLAEPELLILDEPMGGLDPKGIIDIRNLMLKLKEDGKTIFFTSHIISEIEKTADRVAIMHKGKILKTTKATGNLEEEFLKLIDLKNE